MIVVEGTLWPLIFVGVAERRGDAPQDLERLCLIDDAQLAAGDRLLMVAVVAGRGEASGRAQRAVVEWLRRQRPLLEPRMRRLAWVVEDRRVRSSIDEWLELAGRRVYRAPSEAFTRIADAVRWLLDARVVEPAVQTMMVRGCAVQGHEESGMANEACESGAGDEACECECIWLCNRGRTRMACQLRRQGEQIHVEVMRNSRVYGSYRFEARTPALAFADRLRFSLEGNGWVAA